MKSMPSRMSSARNPENASDRAPESKPVALGFFSFPNLTFALVEFALEES